MPTLLPVLVALALAADDPIVLAKGKGFIVHGLPGRTVALVRPDPPPPAALLHTALPSGKTRTLLRTGTTVGVPVPMAIDRYPITQKRLVGVAADGERLYVLVWSATWKYEDFAGKGLVIGKAPESDAYALSVYWLEDGTDLGGIALRGAKRPKTVPAETLDKGPLAVKDGTVAAYGQTFRFRGKKWLKDED
jgi:hypothetical protein